MTAMVEQMHSARAAPHQRNRSSFSFRSNHSDKSLKGNEGNKRTTLTTKANPNAAMTEAEPIESALEAPTITSLRPGTHKDDAGNVIKEPDLSNPTRYRWERPLDTIRAFEASVDGTSKRKSIVRTDSSSTVMNGYGGARTSVYGGYDNGSRRQSQTFGNQGYYGYRSQGDHGYNLAPYGGTPRARPNPRPQPDVPRSPRLGMPHNGPLPPSYRPSHDTAETGSGSNGSPSEQWGTSTNPSSEDSSLEKGPSDATVLHRDPYRRTPLATQNQSREGSRPATAGTYPDAYNQQRPNGSSGTHTPGMLPPLPPPHSTHLPPPAHSAPARNVIKLGGSTAPSDSSSTLQAGATAKTEKRKSWLKRRFSTKQG